jgi:hypothetical protein
MVRRLSGPIYLSCLPTSLNKVLSSFLCQAPNIRFKAEHVLNSGQQGPFGVEPIYKLKDGRPHRAQCGLLPSGGAGLQSKKQYLKKGLTPHIPPLDFSGLNKRP